MHTASVRIIHVTKGESPMSNRLRRAAAAGATTALIATGAVAANTTAAHAATPVCTTTKSVSKGSYYAELPATAGGSTTCQLGPGNSGSAVRQLQSHLSLCHDLHNGGSDGIYGSGTRLDVRTVQSRAGITADGLYGPNTRNVISWRWYSTGNGTATCARL